MTSFSLTIEGRKAIAKSNSKKETKFIAKETAYTSNIIHFVLLDVNIIPAFIGFVTQYHRITARTTENQIDDVLVIEGITWTKLMKAGDGTDIVNVSVTAIAIKMLCVGERICFLVRMNTTVELMTTTNKARSGTIYPNTGIAIPGSKMSER
ncbi:hypothetical protein CHS0354_003361 [Potamilus streckersoni]|uniref:Uncharacterized protein n=1 Tax=Potamilus streckersoni TaxID=2493646 RepID=A0AAE0S5B4_9BIVA|nr:hypothetical protein CHS0354_003361 [Potamilus streckersoni]